MLADPLHTDCTAPFARAHAEPPGELPPLALDRQRVVMSAAFRRLQHKAQVFIAAESDHFRTRLTHTLEVADTARELARVCGLDEALAEVVALAHDLGHPPFGHAGERALDACMKGQGGFEHNAHSLRVVETVEHPYPQFRGLNLTRIVRECLAKHSTRYDQPGSHPLQDGRPAPPEGQIAALADMLAYTMHDLQDGLHAGLLQPADLHTLELWRRCYAGPSAADAFMLRRWLRPTSEAIRRAVVRDIAASAARARPGGGRGAAEPSYQLSPAMRTDFDALAELLRQRVYRDEGVRRRDRRAGRMLTAVFNAFVGDPAMLPERFRRQIDEFGIHRVVADYVAGMTDRFCRQQYRRLARPGGPT